MKMRIQKSSTYVYKYHSSLHTFVAFIMKDSATTTSELVQSFAPVHPRLKEGCDYVMTVKRTFHSHGEPKKYDEFVTIMKDYKEKRFILFLLFLYFTHVVVQGKLCGLLLYYPDINLFSNFFTQTLCPQIFIYKHVFIDATIIACDVVFAWYISLVLYVYIIASDLLAPNRVYI